MSNDRKSDAAPSASTATSASKSAAPAGSGAAVQRHVRAGAQQGFAVQAKSLAPRDAGPPVQRKVAIGASHKEPTKPGPELEELHESRKVHRFESDGEAETYAKSGGIEGMGSMPDGTWARLPPKMLVLGEDHGALKAPQLINATGIKKYRYEAFSHHSAARKEGSAKLRGHLAETEAEGMKIKGGRDEVDSEDHAAEHALPKYARALPEFRLKYVEALAAYGRQIAMGPSIDAPKPAAATPRASASGEAAMLDEKAPDGAPALPADAPAPAVDAAAPLPAAAPVAADDKKAEEDKKAADKKLADKKSGADYDLGATAAKYFLSALIYAQSYGNKRMGHPLKTFYKAHAKRVDDSIALIEASPDRLPVPLPVMPVYAELLEAYTKAARDKVGLKSDSDIKKWKAQLGTKADNSIPNDARKPEPEVTKSPEAKELDYLRDKSMMQTITSARGDGTRLFVVGDAHRQKLEPMIKGLGLDVMKDETWIEKQAQLTRAAGAGVTSDTQTFLDQLKAQFDSQARYKPSREPKLIGDTFQITGTPPAACLFEVTGTTKLGTGKAATYTVSDANVIVRMVWTGEGKRVTVGEKAYPCQPPAPVDEKQPEPLPVAAPPVDAAEPRAPDGPVAVGDAAPA